MAEIIQVPCNAVRAVWPAVAEYLQPAIDMSLGCFAPDDVVVGCEAGNMTLFVAVDGDRYLGATVAEIVQFPRRRAARVVFGGGIEMRRWYAEMDEAVDAWGRAWGCTLLLAQGRRGWARLGKGNEMALLWRDIPSESEVH